MSFFDRLFPSLTARAGLAELRRWASDFLSVEARADFEATLDAIEAGGEVLAALSLEDRALRAKFDDGPGYQVEDGVAVIPLAGPMLPGRSRFLDRYGITYAATPEVTRAVTAAAADGNVAAIVIAADSPGGSVRGVRELDAAVGAAAAQKPVHTHSVGMLASAALWGTARSTRITAAPDAVVGSIGVVSTIDDTSRLYEAAGAKRHVIATGPLKGQGTPGTPVSEAMLAQVREIVDAHFAQFKGAVTAGRGLEGEALERVTTGGFWLAERAQALGLVDAVAPTPDSIAELVGSSSTNAPETGAEFQEDTMSKDAQVSPAALMALQAEITNLGARLEGAEKRATEAEARATEAQGRAEKAEAKAEMLAERLGTVKDDAISAVLDKHCGLKFAAAQRPAWEERARKAFADDPKGLDAFLADLPDVLHSEPKGKDAQVTEPTKPQATGPDQFGLTAEDYELADNVVSLSVVDRTAVTKDGARLEAPAQGEG